MAALNKARRKTPAPLTDGGGPATRVRITEEQQLRRSVMSTLLWEDQFYEDGMSIADRIEQHAAAVPPEVLAQIAVEARSVHNLRHVPLLLVCALAKHHKGQGTIVADTVYNVVQRADELSELLSIYWRNGRTPISNGIKRGLARAFSKFDAHQLAKYNRDNGVKLRDVMFMVHPKPSEKQAYLTHSYEVDRLNKGGYKRGVVTRHAGSALDKLAYGTLESPDTWEVALSAGGDKRTEFTRLLNENKLGYLALLRNLRNMQESGVDPRLIHDALRAENTGRHRVLPFRFIAAGRAAPQFTSALDGVLLEVKEKMPKLPGHTVVMVDVSGSMNYPLSIKSDLTRMDAACALASLINCEKLDVYSFSYEVAHVRNPHGIEGATRIARSQPNAGTELPDAVRYANTLGADRLIVITDEQSTSWRPVPDPVAPKAYMINVASNRNGVGYGKWTHIDGFSEGALRWIGEYEKL